MTEHEIFLKDRVVATAGMYVGSVKALEKHSKLCERCSIRNNDCAFGVSLRIQKQHCYEIMAVAVEEYQQAKITQEVDRI